MIESDPAYAEVEKGSRLSKILSLRYALRHPVAFREYFVPKVSKRPYWGRYAFLPILLSLDKGDALFAAGRGSGKSFAVLEPELVRRAIKGKGEETLLTTFRRVHVVDRMERAIDYFETVPILRLYHRRTNRSPVYQIQTKHGHNLYGICVDLSSNIVNPSTGEVTELKNISAGNKVFSYACKGINSQTVIDAIHNGIKETVRVETASGRYIIVTPEHLLLTDEGWKKAEDCIDARLAVAASIPEPTDPISMPVEQVELLAILLAEGSLTGLTPEFYNEDDKIVSKAREGAVSIGCDINRVVLQSGATGRYTISPVNLVWKWLDNLHVDRVEASKKTVPNIVFRLNNTNLARFMSVLWMTDGYVNPVNGPGLHMASEKFVKQIQHLLLRLSIQSKVEYKFNGYGKNGRLRHSWNLSVYASSFEKFRMSIKLLGDRASKLDRILTKTHRSHGCGWPRASVVYNTINPAWNSIQKRTKTQTLYKSWTVGTDRSIGHLKPTAKRIRGPERLRFMTSANPERIRAWANACDLNNELVSMWTSSDIFWDPVVSIESAWCREVGDISVPPCANFVANDIIVHNSVGDDPEARMAQGKHASTIIIEEAHQYPDRAYKKLQGAKDPRGCNVLMAGVPDGQINTPFRDADKKFESFEGRRVHISRRYDPWFDQKSKKDYAETLGGLDGDLFKQEIDAEWGSPTWSAWSLEAIYSCMTPEVEKQFVSISGKEYRENGYHPEMVLRDLPGNPFDGETYIAADIGYTQPTEAGVFVNLEGKWHLVVRVQMVNRTEHDDQAAILDHLGMKYGAYRIGIDTTDGQGRAIAVELDKLPRWTGRVDRITFSENGIAGYTPEGEEIIATMKEIGTTRLRALFAHKKLAMPKDEDIVAEFNQEKETKGQDGKVRLVTPPDVHIPEMMRVFSAMVHLANPPVPPEGESHEFCLPVWGDSPIWQPTSL